MSAPPRGRSGMRALAPLLLLLAALPLALPTAPAQGEATQALFLFYHVHPEPAGATPPDPFSTPLAPLPPGLADSGGVVQLPATRFDGVLHASGAPEGDPTSVIARFQEARNLVLLRQRGGTPLALAAAPGNGTLAVALESPDGAVPSNLSLEVRAWAVSLSATHPTVGEAQRFVVRRAYAPVPADLSTPGKAVVLDVPAEPEWDASFVVAVSVAPGAGNGRLQDGEVLQAALVQDRPVRWSGKTVLVEHATATWCEACQPADAALSLLAGQLGFDAQDAGAAAYPSPFSLLSVAGALGGAWLGVALLRRRGA